MTNIYRQQQRQRCLACKKSFIPARHIGSRQKYCLRKECQSKRQRLNEQAWYKRPENQKFIKAKQRRWRKRHREYWKQWRQNHPDSLRRNRKFMQEYQRRKRQDQMFAKTKSLTSQVTKNKGVVYTSRGNTWFLMRLQRPSQWTKVLGLGYASKGIKKSKIRLPRGRLWDLSNVFGTRRRNR